MKKLTKIITFQSQKNDDIFHIFDQIKVLRIPSRIVNWALLFLHGGSLEIPRTVPLITLLLAGRWKGNVRLNSLAS